MRFFLAIHLCRLILHCRSGYIGGGILTALLRDPNASSFTINAVVRDATKAARLQADFGVNATVGSHNDRALVEPLAAAADVVITAANVDDMDAAKAILDGMRRRKEESGISPVLIHTVCSLLQANPMLIALPVRYR
jgi:hypothetical protein